MMDGSVATISADGFYNMFGRRKGEYHRPYAYYGQYKTVIAVGEAKNKSGHTNVLIQG